MDVSAKPLKCLSKEGLSLSPSHESSMTSGKSLSICSLQLLSQSVRLSDITWEIPSQVASGPGLHKSRVFMAAAGLSVGLVPAVCRAGKAGQ